LDSAPGGESVVTFSSQRPRFQAKKLRMTRGAVHHKLWGDGINIGEGPLK
jgi:hypothetical protein